MPAKILVVDDEPSIVDVLTRFLSREGYSVVTAANGREALEQVRQDPPDLILLDVTMPELDGFTVCQQLKEDERTALIPITMLTGLDDREHRTRGIEAGADDFLTKPFEQSILRARIRSQLRLKRLTDQLEHTENVIFMLAQAVEAKDAYTEGHLRRLRAYGEQLALWRAACRQREVRGGALWRHPARYRQDRRGRGDYSQAWPADARGGCADAPAPRDRRADHLADALCARCRADYQRAPRILGWQRLPARPERRGDPDRRADYHDRGCLRCDDDRSALSRGAGEAETMRRLRVARGTQFDPELLDIFIS